MDQIEEDGKLDPCTQIEENIIKRHTSMDRIEEGGVRYRLEKRMKHEEQLLPGIVDEITLKYIVTKLAWREVYVAARVNRGWHNAIYGLPYRQVYNARVRSSLTETFIIVEAIDDEDGERRRSRLVLCCLRDNSCRKLPPFPPRRQGYHASHWIVVDGTVYAWVGSMLYALDLAGQRRWTQWTQCANMPIPRFLFSLGSMDGKIYVFGGMSKEGLCSRTEMFDPKENRWSLMAPMPVPTFLHEVVGLGDELVMKRLHCQRNTGRDFLEIYHPLKDEWRTVFDPFQSPSPNNIFVAEGKLHSLNHSGIYVQNFDGNSCTELHSISLAAMEDADSLLLVPLATLVVDDEIFVVGVLENRLHVRHAEDHVNIRYCLLRSRGFGSEKKEIAWREETDWPSKGCTGFMHAIEL